MSYTKVFECGSCQRREERRSKPLGWAEVYIIKDIWASSEIHICTECYNKLVNKNNPITLQPNTPVTMLETRNKNGK